MYMITKKSEMLCYLVYSHMFLTVLGEIPQLLFSKALEPVMQNLLNFFPKTDSSVQTICISKQYESLWPEKRMKSIHFK